MKSTKHIYGLLAALAATTTLSLTPSLAADTTDTPSSTAPTYIDITINHVAESTGIEMGDGARARGTGSIATGRNSVAIGKNAVATGGNENKDTITQKLNENKEKLAEIETAQNNVNTFTDDLQTIRAKYADVIEAGTRVKQVQEAKEKARLSWQDKLSAYNTAVDGSKQYLADAQAKIDDLNSRLDGVSKLGGVDISSESGLTTAATQLKAIVEKDTTLNLSQDFYKDYVKSYYQALGDLRQNQIIYSKTNFESYCLSHSEANSSVINPFECWDPLESENPMRGIGSSDDGTMQLYHGRGSTIGKNIFSADTSIFTPSSDLVGKNINTDTSTLYDWQTAQAVAPQYKAGFKTYFTNTNDRFMTDEVRTALLNRLDTQVDIFVKSNEVAYYQGQYEATKNTTWLDKKKKALDEYNSLVTAYNNLPNVWNLRQNAIAAWKKANITDIQDKNKVTTDTLTSELEKALNISKNAITKKQKELADLKATADQAKTNYEAINPDQKDLYLSAQYDTVMKQLTDKATELKASQDKLDALKAALTLNDLTNTGENAYAIGTDALATGTNAYAIGTSAVATGESSLAIGNGAIATGTQALAVGTGATVFGDHSGAFGNPNTVYGTGSYAIGNDNTLGAIDSTTKKPLPDKGNNTFVLGSHVTTTANNAVILGYDSTDGGDNTVSVGSSTQTRRLVHVGDGQSATDAATVGQTATLGSTNGSVKITKSTNANGSTNYDLAIDKITANGVIASGNTGILSGGTAYNYLQNAVFYDASAKDLLTFKGASGTRLTNLKDATLSATSTDAVTGRQLYTTNQNISGFANQITKNASKLEALSTSVTNSLDSVSAMSESVSTIDSTKADASLNNLSDAGKEVIHAAATEAVQAYMKNLNGAGSAKSTVKALSAKMYTVPSSSLLATGLLAMPTTSAVSTLDSATDLSAKADVSYVDEGLSTKADKDTVYTKEETDQKLTGKADTDLKNLTDAGKGVIKDVMKDDMAKKADKSAVDEALTKKADVDGSNIDASAYAKKLGTGAVASGDTNLVTGNAVYTALSKSGIGLVQSDGQTMTVGAKDSAAVVDFHNASGSGRVLTGVTTNASDLTSAANVGYVNSVANGMAQDFTNQIQQTSSMLTRDINKVGAGAAALAGLHPGEYDPADKWDFAAGYGHYKGANASAFGAYYHPNEDTLISLSGTIGNGDPMLSAGVTFKLGSGVSPHTMSRTALTKELSAVQQQNQALAVKNQQLESDVETLKAQVRQLLASLHTPSK
ncbi:YadA-like family protein [Megasphaera sp.]|uniref:YadA-like family protein n=1 Tax=Megasphaera sp. TaxID=2023260 RepID=UPI00402568B9